MNRERFIPGIRLHFTWCAVGSLLLFLFAFSIGLAQQKTREVDIGCDFVPEAREPIYDSKELARLLQYPMLAQQKGIEGEVRVRVRVGPTGKFLNAAIHRSSDTIFEANVLDAVRKLHYVPATQGGHPISAWLSITVVFTLSDSTDMDLIDLKVEE